MRRHAQASIAESTQGSGTRRGHLGLVCLCVLGLAAFLGSSAPAASAQACPNEAFRQGPSGHLPDCRAYEMVTPVDMEGEEPGTEWGEAASGPEAAANGNGVAWSAFGTFGESATSNSAADAFLSRRGASDWSTEQVSPPFSPTLNIAITVAEAFTPNLDKTVSFDGGVEPPLTPDASAGTSNLYLRDNTNSTFQLITVGLGEGLGYTESRTKGMSADASHVVFLQSDNREMAGSNCAPPATTILCDWDAATGTVSLIGVSPGGEVLEGSAVAIAGPEWARVVSADGSRIFFKGGGEGCGVCVRINAATTQIVSETGTFQIASSDGSLAYVTDGGALERYDVNADVLTPLTEAADEVQGVLGASTDGSRVYFVAKGELAPGATGGENNLYLWTEGAGFEFIATGNTSGAFTNNYRTNNNPNSRVTPDGMHLAFTANNSLTGFPHAGIPEVYLFSAATGALVCASCNPSGEPEPGGSGGSIEVGGGSPGPDLEGRLRRNLSDNGGRLFFNTDEALVPRDANGLQDVYEYDAASGQVALISTGTAGPEQPPNSTGFADASPSGNDVLFQTRQQLVGVDEDEALSIYDARVDGGLASQNPPAPAAPCTGDACRSATSPIPSQPSTASAAFAGKGNLSSKQNCNKLAREAKKLSNRAKRLRKDAKQAKRNGKSAVAKKRNRKATRLAKHARKKSKSAKKCRKANRRASK
ncbi:MAG TPA: hypothetical protein VFZ41_04595 [Solirubrobacterales bacterium]